MVYALVCISVHILLGSKIFLKDLKKKKVLLYHKCMFVKLQKLYKILKMTVVTWVTCRSSHKTH